MLLQGLLRMGLIFKSIFVAKKCKHFLAKQLQQQRATSGRSTCANIVKPGGHFSCYAMLIFNDAIDPFKNGSLFLWHCKS